ncbi:hypothetical protein AO069_10080 [Pseudomonas syringae pv. syringae PD2774]|uniref:hypothetical protein n=1 Tax=Pseudomonas syringae TaxID=317 RepID=UPI000736E5CF|nr:hypothetical protein [Pseudomonas syringae]KTB79270.1 hypothetical protein AO069_10080 [Pseudomonas syringae pv. syringae PD2774]
MRKTFKGCAGLLAIAIFQLISFSTFAETAWIRIAETDDGTRFETKPGSFEFSETRGKTPVAVLVGRQFIVKSKKIELQKWYVTATDCKNKMGKLTTLSVSGEFQFENDFVFDGGTVASTVAKFICDVAGQSIKNAASKGL